MLRVSELLLAHIQTYNNTARTGRQPEGGQPQRPQLLLGWGLVLPGPEGVELHLAHDAGEREEPTLWLCWEVEGSVGRGSIMGRSLGVGRCLIDRLLNRPSSMHGSGRVQREHTHLQHQRQGLLLEREEGEDGHRPYVPKEQEANAEAFAGAAHLVEHDLRGENEGEADRRSPAQYGGQRFF